MLGPPKPRRLDEPVTVSLERLVPPNHLYRHLEAKLDLGFVREWARGLYADRGRPSIDPVIFFKLHLVMFFEGIRSEGKLIDTASLHLAHRWYLGHARALQEADGVATAHRPAPLHDAIDPHAGHCLPAEGRHRRPVVLRRRPQDPDVPRQVRLRQRRHHAARAGIGHPQPHPFPIDSVRPTHAFSTNSSAPATDSTTRLGRNRRTSKRPVEYSARKRSSVAVVRRWTAA